MDLYGVADGNGRIYQAARDMYVFERPAYRWEAVRPDPAPPDPAVARRRPGTLLAAGRNIVEFGGRAPQLRELADWRDGPERVAVRLVSGPAGQGKTRLARHFAALSAEAGWQARGVRRPGDALTAPVQGEDDDGPLLVVVDYAERWDLGSLLGMLADVSAQARSRIRFLFLSRTSGLWWYSLSHRLRDAFDLAAEAAPLPVLAPSSQDRADAFAQAVRCFARAMDVDARIRPPERLAEDAAYSVALTVHMAALVALDAHLHGETPPQDPGRLSEYLLAREHRHWEDLHAHAGHLPTVDAPSMRRAVFTAALAGPLGHLPGSAVLQDVGLAGDPAAAQRLLDAHAQCHPPQDAAAVLEPLHPDRLAEDFIALLLPGHAQDHPADPWAGTALRRLLRTPESPHVRQALTVLIEAAARWEHVAREWLHPLLLEEPRLALSAGGAALIALAGLPGLEPSVLEALQPHLPERNVELDAGIAACVERWASHRLASARGPAEQAELHCLIGRRKGVAGLNREAIEHLRLAARLRRAAGPNVGLAWDLLNLGVSLAHEGKYQEAYGALHEALALFEREPLPPSDGLAGTLDMLGVVTSHLGLRGESLAFARRVVDLRRLLARHGDEHSARLGRALVNLGNRLFDDARGRPSKQAVNEARIHTNEAVGIFRRLAASAPDAYAPDLARALVNRAEDLFRARRDPEATAAIEEAVGLYRALAEINPPAFRTDLCQALLNQGAHFSQAQRHQEARDRAAEVVAMLGTPVNDLQRSLLVLATARLALGHACDDGARDTEEAAAQARAAVALYRAGSLSDSVQQYRHLARGLAPLALRLAARARRDEALLVLEAVGDLHRTVLRADPLSREDAPYAATLLRMVEEAPPSELAALLTGRLRQVFERR